MQQPGTDHFVYALLGHVDRSATVELCRPVGACVGQLPVEIERGARAYVERWGGKGVIDAQVRRIDPSAFARVSALGIEEQRVRLLLDILTLPEQRQGLGDQYRVFVRIVTWAGEDVLQIPQSALFRHAERWAVFMEENGRAKLRYVDVGHMSGEAAEILNGVEPGERVVAYPGAAVESGVKIEPRLLSVDLDE